LNSPLSLIEQLSTYIGNLFKMANATVSRVGQVNGAGDATELFLKVFAGEVLTSFHNANVMMGRHMVRTISSGKSAQFPVIGTATAGYHTPGTEITGQVIKGNERVIGIDGQLIADVFIDNLDEAMSHYDLRAPYAEELGTVLANTMDANVQQVLLKAAAASATVDGGNGGSELTLAGYATDGAALANGIFDAAQILDEKNVPDMNRMVNLKPAQYYLLAQNTNVINKDWGGSGSYADGTVLKVANVELVKTNQLPTTNVTSGPATYQGDFSNTAFVVYHPSAVGTVKLLDLAMESSYDLRRQGTLMLAKYASGHGILRPECVVAGKSA
jgi:hypothetical protein